MTGDMVLDNANVAAEELAKLKNENKKLRRELKLAQTTINRNKVMVEARESMHEIFKAQKSDLEKYMNLLLDNCPDIIMLFDKDGKIVYCTGTFLKLARIPVFSMISKMFYRDLLKDFVPESFLQVADDAFHRIFTDNQVISYDAILDFSKTGNLRNYSIQLNPMANEAGVIEGAMAFFYDCTDLITAKKEAERANAAKSDFLATVSHEIRTPMNAIMGLSEMMKVSGLDEKQQEMLSKIQSSSNFLLQLINDILDISKIEAGKLELMPDYFSLSGLLDNLRDIFETMHRQKNLEFITEFDDALPKVVYGDEKRVRQILTNIINNAQKYTKEGKVTFTVVPEKDDIIRFDIKDTGIGIKEEEIPRLFKAFEQIDTVRNKNIVGTGLGLAITDKLCDLMHGNIGVESEYGRGSTFSVRLPLKTGSETDLDAVDEAVVEFSAGNAQVLLVDDIEINLQVAEFMLEAYGITPQFAYNGKQAVELAAQGDYDLILMDHMMPEMDGVEATRLIRDANIDVPIVALTANATNEAINMFLANGFNAFLAKPMEDSMLAKCLLRLLPEHLIEKRHN